MNHRRTKKFLTDVYTDSRFTLRQKVVLRKTYSVFDCLKMAEKWKAQ